MENLDHYLLGETDQNLTCLDAEANREIAVAMIRQADRRLDILSRDLEPDIYDNEACRDAVLDLALSGRKSRVRILIHEPAKVLGRGHGLLELGMRLDSRVQMRKPAPEHERIAQTFMIVDEVGLLYREYCDSYKATANFNDTYEARRLSNLFSRIWEFAEHDPNLRRLML